MDNQVEEKAREEKKNLKCECPINYKKASEAEAGRVNGESQKMR